LAKIRRRETFFLKQNARGPKTAIKQGTTGKKRQDVKILTKGDSNRE